MTKKRAIAAAVREAQQLADADGRPYLVTRGPGRERPYITPLAGLEMLGSIIAESIAARMTLLVSPSGMHRGLSAAEIVAAESQ